MTKSRLNLRRASYRLITGESRRFIGFALVGVVGFLVDTGVLYLGLAAGLGLRLARIPSYLTAATTTWALNRRYTFDYRPGNVLHQWAKFVTTQLGGAALNLGVYNFLVGFGTVARHPVIGVAAGSLAGLALNYLLARVFVFRDKAPPR